jgi:hypothetical protein
MANGRLAHHTRTADAGVRVDFESPGGDPPTRTFPSVLVLGAGRIVVCESAVPTVGERE